MAQFHNQSLVANQAGTQNIYGDVYFTTSPSIPAVISDYNLGLRLGAAPQINDELFVGREEELEQLQSWLSPTKGKQNVVALWGMGGIGKTQLSLRFIRDHGHRYSAVFWLDARDYTTLQTSMAKLMGEVRDTEITLSPTSALEEEQQAERARRWLSEAENDRWMLVLDNYDDVQLSGHSNTTGYDIRKFFPHRVQGSILINTRSPQLTFARGLALNLIEKEEESLLILARRSGRKTDGDLSACHLVRRLEGLPLALATAGAYLRLSTDSFEDYLQLYNQNWCELSRYDEGPRDYQDRTLYNAWDLSFQQVQVQDPAAAELLKTIAYFDRRDLWYELFFNGLDFQSAPDWWTELLQNRTRFNRAVLILANYSLLHIRDGQCSLHTCVHDWTLEHLNRELDSDRFRLAIHCVSKSVINSEKAEYWIKNRRLLTHAQRLRQTRLQKSMDWGGCQPADYKSLSELYEQARMLLEAEEMYIQALQEQEKVLGVDHVDTIQTVNDLGWLYLRQKRIMRAEGMLLRALQAIGKTLENDHVLTFEIYNNLGIFYSETSQESKAEEMYQRALKGTEKARGLDHRYTLGTVYNLGMLYSEMGQEDKAEAMYRRALQGYQKTQGADNVDALDIVYMLGSLYKDQGKMVEAEAMYQRALNGYEKAFGSDHKETIDTIFSLGSLYEDDDKTDEAEVFYQLALQGYEKTLGSDYKDTIDTVFSLGSLYEGEERIEEAEAMYNRALQGYEKTLGSDHKDTIDTVFSLGSLYDDQERIEEAQVLYERALKGYEKILGIDHTETLETVQELGDVYSKQGKISQAEEMYQRAFQGFKTTLGDEDPQTQRAAESLQKLHNPENPPEQDDMEVQIQESHDGQAATNSPEKQEDFIPQMLQKRQSSSLKNEIEVKRHESIKARNIWSRILNRGGRR